MILETPGILGYFGLLQVGSVPVAGIAWIAHQRLESLVRTRVVPDLQAVQVQGGREVMNLEGGSLRLGSAEELHHLRPDQASEQAMFYLKGIFKGEVHPFEKKPEKKLNPLQQVTYIGLLNVLLPLQGLTGILMWGAQRWPDLTERLGGLTCLAPLHTIVAWLFAAFIVMHVYLTTTGHKPLTDIQAMITGWEDVEVHETHESISGEAEPAVQTAAAGEEPQAAPDLPVSDAEVG